MVHIKKVKLFNGELRYAVVSKVVSTAQDEKGQDIPRVEYLPVDYKVGKEIHSAIFPVTDEGLNKAKEIQKLFKNKKK